MRDLLRLKLQTLRKKQSVKLESNGTTHDKLIETYIHCHRAAKNTHVRWHGIHNYKAWTEKVNKRWLLVRIKESLSKWHHFLEVRIKKKSALQSQSKASSEWWFCWTDERTHISSESNQRPSCQGESRNKAACNVDCNDKPTDFSWAANRNICMCSSQLASSQKSTSKYPFRTPRKEFTTTFY